MGNFASSSNDSNKKLSLQDITSKIKNKEIKEIIIMCGAGISTSANVPDFRSPGLGIYFKLKKYNLPYPEAICESSYFKQNPEPFYSLVREIYPQTLTPTRTHKFFKLLESKNLLTRIYTQNIDALEHLARIDSNKIIEAHGTFQTNTCLKCNKKNNLEWLKSELNSHTGAVTCSNKSCNGSVKPDVVLFGDQMPRIFFEQQKPDFKKCDLLIILGTSLTVEPFASLIGNGNDKMIRLFINKTKPGKVNGLLGFFTSMNMDFSKPTDCVELGYCDEIVGKFCKLMGWGTKELDSIEVDTLT